MQDEGSPNTIKNNLLCEVTTELPIGSELANTFENKFIYEQIPQNLINCILQIIKIQKFNIALYT